MAAVSKLSKVTFNKRGHLTEKDWENTVLRGGLYGAHGVECGGVVQGLSRLDYTIFLESVMILLHARGMPLV